MENLPKQYLYHQVPEDMTSNEEGKKILYPLNVLKEKFPGLYEIKAGKYMDKNNPNHKDIPETIIPTLGVTWGDVIQLTAVHPEDLKNELIKAGFEPKEFKFYQIDPELLNPEDTTIFLYKDDTPDDDSQNFKTYDPSDLQEHSVVSEATKEYYQNRFTQQRRPLLFVKIPHIFHKGQIDVSDFPVITV